MEVPAGSWRRLYSEELHNLYPSPNFIRVTILSKVRWAGNVQGCIQKFPDWPSGARTANGTALCH
jgi:hypothetical protein